MYQDLKDFERAMRGAEAAVIGIGISNRPLIRYLCSLGTHVTACDKRPEGQLGADVIQELQDLGVRLKLGPDYLKNIEQPLIFKTPGLRFDVPELQEARRKGAKVTSEMEVFFDVCPSKIIAVTGSDGKTTTTTLIYKMLCEAGYKVWLGGNIGNPLLSQTRDMRPEDYVVLELSSFQLHTLQKSPSIAVITNISPNHLDVHKSYEEYIEAKKNIMLYQKPEDVLVVNADNAVTRQIGGEAKGRVLYFSAGSEADVCLKDGMIYRGGQPVLAVRDIKVPGRHNVENYMAAIAAVGEMAGKDAIFNVATTFGGVEHRIELVRELDGVRYYNSSIDSSPNRTINTLKVFPNKVILIAGGKDKGIPYDDIGPAIAEHVKVLLLIGATADRIEEAYRKADAEGAVECIRCTSYEEVVQTARRKAAPGDVVLLSPASTSFDMFNNFEERGNLFKKLVHEL